MWFTWDACFCNSLLVGWCFGLCLLPLSCGFKLTVWCCYVWLVGLCGFKLVPAFSEGCEFVWFEFPVFSGSVWFGCIDFLVELRRDWCFVFSFAFVCGCLLVGMVVTTFLLL